MLLRRWKTVIDQHSLPNTRDPRPLTTHSNLNAGSRRDPGNTLSILVRSLDKSSSTQVPCLMSNRARCFHLEAPRPVVFSRDKCSSIRSTTPTIIHSSTSKVKLACHLVR